MKVCNCRNVNETAFRETLTNKFANTPVKLERGDAPNTLSDVYKKRTDCDFNCGKCQDHLASLCAEHNQTVAAVKQLINSLPQQPAPATIKPHSNDPVC